MAAVVSTTTRDGVFAGMLLASVAYMLFSGQDAAIKLLVAGISVWQILFLRSVVILAGCAAVGGVKLFRETARSPIVKPMFLRSVLMLGAWLCFYNAARSLQLAEMTTIYFAAPVIVTIMSVVILKERVTLLRWTAAWIGFIGVFIACDPANLGFTLPVVLVLAAAALWALSIVLMRKMALQERTIIQVVLNNCFFLVTAAVPMLLVWKTPDLGQTALMVLVGVIGGAAQYALFEGMKRAEASVIAPFEYTSLIWAFVFGYLIWSEVPRIEVYAGAGLIMLAGVIIIVGERFRPSR